MFAVVLAALVALVAATMGIGKPSLPEGALAIVDGVGDPMEQEELDAALEQAAASQQLPEVPAPDDPQYGTLLIPAVSDVLLSRWVAGEAEERGIDITDREIDAELQTIIDEQFGGQKEFDKFLEESGFSEEEARERVELQLQTQCIQDRVIPQDPEAEVPQAQREGCQGEEELEITDQEIEDFYNENKSQLRDARDEGHPHPPQPRRGRGAGSRRSSSATTPTPRRGRT